MYRSLACLGLVLGLGIGFVAPLPAAAQGGDWGDAPEGSVAYPFLGGVLGRFPTCQNVPINGFIRHGPTPPLWAYFGPTEDYEGEGNSGQCPMFNPYDSDECFQDGDAGLLFPGAWTIQGGAEVPCQQPDTLVAPCSTAVWGVDIDIWVENNGPFDGYVNVIADWNQDGVWMGSSQCPNGTTPEHIVVNLWIPANYVGPLSGRMPIGSGFLAGPNFGWVWFRFSIMEAPVPLPWDGNGIFEGGESEDYLLLLDQGGGPDESDYGDAPEGATAYPNGIMGNFPTCRTVGPAGWIQHQFAIDPHLVYFGPLRDDESDGNAGTCPAFAPYDLDECFQDGDAGLLLPSAYTMVANTPVPCTAPPGSLKALCQWANWGPDIDIDVTNFGQFDAFVNVLADWSGDGRWGGSVMCPGGPAPEYILADWPVPAGFSGALSLLGPPSFLGGPNMDYVWMRFTVTPQPLGLPDWEGEGEFDDGETEDYMLLLVDPAVSSETLVGAPLEIRLHESVPNPTSLGTTIRFDLPEPMPVSLKIFDVSGRLVRTLVHDRQGEGQHRVRWDGRNDAGVEVGAGVYYYRLDAGEYTATHRLVLLR